MTPSTPEELADAIRATPRVLAVGARTKPRLSQVGDGVALLSTRGLSGIVEYDPSEFTFTALAGTSVREIAVALAERGQYLPFDPPFMDAGATLGGTVAAGLGGPGRFRYGGLRDFILGVRFVDGLGRSLRLGGKVVKNAAGFDVPKFLVGSLGRFGVLAEVTFKVFPRAAGFRTLRIPVPDTSVAAEVMMAAARTRWEIDALEYAPLENAVFIRLGGPSEALDALSTEIFSRWPEGMPLTTDEAGALWLGVREFRWAHAEGVLAKIALTPKALPALGEAMRGIADARMHIGAGGNVAFVSIPKFEPQFDGLLREQGLGAMIFRGEAPLWGGERASTQVAGVVKAAFDPDGRFPSIDL